MSQDIYDSPNSNLTSQSNEFVSLTIKEILFSFNGRIGRATYWGAMLGMFGVAFVAVILASLLQVSEQILGILIIVGYIPLLWISLAVQIKRWHDRDKSGWWVFISFIPLIGPIWAFVENGCLAGTDGLNSFGPPNR